MATFSNNSKSSQASFTTKIKDADTWTNLPHSDIEGFGFDVQTFDNAFETFDQTGNVLITQWSVENKETG
ncbi:MAG: hypothetical protein KGL39_15040 [Patescibacteria group bacterium]|nr:hypothetical protein [Patescibacteria group bacterium]